MVQRRVLPSGWPVPRHAGCNLLSKGQGGRGRAAPITQIEGKSGDTYTALLKAGAHFDLISNVFEILKRKCSTTNPFLTGCSDKSMDGIVLLVQGHGAV